MPTRDITLTEYHDKFIANGIEAGRYDNLSDAIHVALRLLERHEQKSANHNEWLRDATRDAFAALDRGEGVVLNSVADVDVFIEGIVPNRVSKSTQNA